MIEKNYPQNLDERINELELRYMHQERTIHELNEIVCQQALGIEQLKRELTTLKEQFRHIAPSINRDPDQEEPPPHY